MLTCEVLFAFVAATAQIMKLFFDEFGHFGVRFVAIETQSAAGVVNEIVVTLYALLVGVIFVSEADCEHGTGGIADDLFIVRASGLHRCENKYHGENTTG